EIEGLSMPGAASTGYAVRPTVVAPGFFEVMASPLIAGRAFLPSEDAAAVAVVDDAFAERFLPGEDAVGRRIRFSDVPEEGTEWRGVIGVVRRVGVDAAASHTPPGIYTPLDPFAPDVYMAVHVPESPEDFPPHLRAISASVDPAMRLWDLASLEELAERAALPSRSATLLVSMMAIAALTLCLAGVYALMSFIVSRRIREIGIRTALGAGPRRIVSSIFSRALIQLGLGLAAGVLVSIVLGGGWSASLESGSLVAVARMMGIMGLLACALPTWRALRVQPTEAFREV